MSKKRKIAILGAGNAGCVTALSYYNYGKDLFDIEIYYDPNTPIERVGQGTTPDVAELLYNCLDATWYDNKVSATLKSGILYENWGKKKEKIFHDFPLHLMSCHYVPNLVSKSVLESGFFKVYEKDVEDPEKEIDADYIFDCRGKNKNNPDEYRKLINPLNSAFLSRKEGRDYDLKYTRCVATPDGWTFVIPNTDSVSYGYLYNSNITDKETAKNNFIELFDVVPDGEVSFNNYIAKNVFVGERTILNGNRLSFLEPLEATSTTFYKTVAYYAWEYMMNGISKEVVNQNVQKEMKRIESFILWHYQNGSKYDTNFWKYAKSLPFKVDNEFKNMIEYAKVNSTFYCKSSPASYSIWNQNSFKIWNDNV